MVCMVTNTRGFLRNFATYKAKARQSLLGVAKGKIVFHDDLTKPTLTDESWKPSL